MAVIGTLQVDDRGSALTKLEVVKNLNGVDREAKDPFNDGSEIAFYKFNDNANDEYNSYNLTAKSGTTYESGVSNNGIATSSDSYAWIKNQDFMKNVQKYLSIWVKNKQNGDKNVILNIQQNGAGWSNLDFNIVNGKVKIGGRNDDHSNASYTNIYESQTTLNNTDWYYIVLNKKDNTTYELYINGQLDGTFDFTFYEPTDSYRQVVGAFINGTDNNQPHSSNTYNLAIDNLRVFNRPLTQEEVLELYKGGGYKFSDYFTLDLDGTVTQTKKVPEAFGTQSFLVKAINEAGDVGETFVLSIKDVDSKDLLEDGSEIAFYKFNDNVNDEYGNYNGAATNIVYVDSSIEGKAVKGGSGKYIDFGANYDNPKSLSYWVKPSSDDIKASSSWYVISCSNKDSTNSIMIAVRNKKFTTYNNTTTILLDEEVVADNNYHIVLVDKGGSKFDYYINNVLVKEDLNHPQITMQLKYLFKDISGNQPFNGSIDNLRVFNRPLTQEEVQTIYDIEKPQ